MYKTVKLDLQKKFELGFPYWVEIIPTAWLSKTRNAVLANLYKNSRVAQMTEEERKELEDSNPEAIARAVDGLDQDFEFICKALCEVVIDWNLTDDDEHKIDTPKKLDNDGKLIEVLSAVPSTILTYIFEAASSEDYSEIPLVNSKRQEVSLTAPTPIRQEAPIADHLVEDQVPLPLS